jgi:ABC-type antimicrobial peptide transport system permease subunit
MSVDKGFTVRFIRTFTDQVDHSLSRERLVAALSSFFGGLALLPACIGLYGIMSYTVARRITEIGIRIALGARRGTVIWNILRETLTMTMLGVVIGIPITLAAARLVSSQLFGLNSSDPLTIAGATLLLILIAAIAGYLPARRASRVDPLVALRYE